MQIQRIDKSVQEHRPHIKVGEKVIITNPEYVLRVGYQMDYWDVYDNIEHLKPNCVPLIISPTYLQEKALANIRRGQTLLYLIENNFGGRKRSIFTEHHSESLGLVFTVKSTQRVMTGIRYSDGLSDTKYHILLELDWTDRYQMCLSFSRNKFEQFSWIEDCNVKRVP